MDYAQNEYYRITNNVIPWNMGGMPLTPKTSNPSPIPVRAEDRVLACIIGLFGCRSSNFFFIFSIPLFGTHFLVFYSLYLYNIFVVGVAAGSCSYHQSSITVSKHKYTSDTGCKLEKKNPKTSSKHILLLF